ATIFSLPSFGQESTDTKWVLAIDFGIQAHDKRLFGSPLKGLFLEQHPETYGTYQFGISAVRKILHNERFEIFAGGGLSSELSTFTRPFDNYFRKKGLVTREMRYTNRYYQNLLQLPIMPSFRVGDRFALSLELLPQFSFLTIADNTTKVPTYSWWRFDFYSLEVNPGLSFDIGRVEFGMKYRAFQVKKIDKILFNRIINDPRTDQVFETYNPFKLWFSVGYKL
ncbi:MAG: hypothetical protein ACE5FF_11900, partial [Saprospiraceae bacterium]